MKKAIQDLYPENLAHCYGCGKLNPAGHQLKTYLDEEGGTMAHFTPKSEHTALLGSVYGGLIASLLDCHGTGSAAAFVCIEDKIPFETPLPVRCVTASLKIDFKAMTPMGVPLVLKGKLRSIEGRKIWVDMTLSAGDILCATGEILAIRLKEE
ncbi:PaaI family thioesterase [Myroides sp. 1354]|uniref:PaaI family thioesterase n=1 Tax=unclassified Myroides TaxID=2642485 RepID=UPI00257644D2|nr:MULTISPECIES: PaaI family thioesterase [unclassified Myroides]MDM1044398.1 PaaI family thioesterase [Myroides sp. R163-1]MDM1056273.1 PaaI family thioesterase [Myroides sp. 1354]MDM1069371.1 PaaI family thioesterase [Myroides sp. 1372]